MRDRLLVLAFLAGLVFVGGSAVASTIADFVVITALLMAGSIIPAVGLALLTWLDPPEPVEERQEG